MTDAQAHPGKTVTEPPLLRVARGGVIFREGDSALFAYLVKDGIVDIVKSGAAGETVISTLSKGAVFGEMAVIDGSPRSATARAQTDVVLVEIDRATFVRHIATNPGNAMKLMSDMAGKLRRATQSAAGSALGGPEAGSARLAAAPPLIDVQDTEALYEAPPSRLMVAAGLSLAAFVAAIGLWMSLTSVDKAVSARGRLTTTVPNAAVQATESAIVEEFLTGRGQRVSRGDVLVRLDGTVARANLRVVVDKLNAVEQRLTRLRREQEAIAGDRPPDTTGLDPVGADILLRRVEEYRARLAAFETQRANLDQEIAVKESDAALASEQLEAKQQIESARETLRQREAGSLLTLLTARDERVRATRELHATRSAGESLRAQRASTIAERNAFVAGWHSELARERAREDEQRFQLTEERIKLERQTRDLLLRAPADGIVLDLPKVGAGSVVQAGESLVTLVPANVPLVLDLDVDPRDAGDLHPGVPVSVKLDALPFQQFGDFPGTLVYISDDTHAESLSGERGIFYRARVELAPEVGASLPPGFRLTPGMLAAADLKVGERRLITYFTDPIVRNLRTAFREAR